MPRPYDAAERAPGWRYDGQHDRSRPVEFACLQIGIAATRSPHRRGAPPVRAVPGWCVAGTRHGGRPVTANEPRKGDVGMAVVTMRQLLESGVHFGHQTRRWNPKMKRFIFTERNGIYIIDLQQSLTYIDNAYDFVKQTVAHGGSILFVGTKKQAQEPVAEQAARVGMPYVNQRWLGGMLTNFQTVHKRLQKLKELELLDFDDVAASGMTKKELLVLRREKDKLEKTLGGIRDMAKVPSAVWIIDTKKEHLAVDECKKLVSRSWRSSTPTATPTRSTTRSRQRRRDPLGAAADPRCRGRRSRRSAAALTWRRLGQPRPGRRRRAVGRVGARAA
jgi:small subunit ribosomal protein S2